MRIGLLEVRPRSQESTENPSVCFVENASMLQRCSTRTNANGFFCGGSVQVISLSSRRETKIGEKDRTENQRTLKESNRQKKWVKWIWLQVRFNAVNHRCQTTTPNFLKYGLLFEIYFGIHPPPMKFCNTKVHFRTFWSIDAIQAKCQCLGMVYL